jgi:hypothetical protein
MPNSNAKPRSLRKQKIDYDCEHEHEQDSRYTREAYGAVTKCEMKSTRYLYVVYPGFLNSFSDFLTISGL